MGWLLRTMIGSNSSWTVKDAQGYYLNDDQMQNSTHVRTIDLSSLAGKTVNSLDFTDEADTAAGSWAIIYEQVSLVSTDGTVFPVYTGQTSSPVSSISSAAGVTGAGSSIDNNRGHAIYPTLTTTYYSADHLGSARMITSGNGYPVWSGVFAPFGREVNPQITMNNYKFTDEEHDSESNLEHTWFRQLSTTEGRWLSPDPYSGSMDLTNPQSLNRYAYVGNNPVNAIDPLGLADQLGHCDDTHFNAGCILGAPGPGGICTMDGVDTPCSMAYGVLSSGQGCLGSCVTSVTGSNGNTYQAVQTAGPTVYIGPNGEELSDGSIAELGLPPLPELGFSPFVNGGAGGGAGGTQTTACQGKILKAVNNHFGTSFTAANVGSGAYAPFQWPKVPGGTVNIDIFPQQGQATGIAPGRYPASWWTYIVGYGSTRHIPAGPGGLDSPSTLVFSASQFTVHLDSAFPYNPIGLIFHGLKDVAGMGGHNPCP